MLTVGVQLLDEEVHQSLAVVFVINQEAFELLDIFVTVVHGRL